LVFNIQRFSLHDGPGIRTLIFLKGCPLACAWCANPEGIAPHPEMAVAKQKCLGSDECDQCVQACPNQAIKPERASVRIDADHCEACGACADACPAGAVTRFGKWMTVPEVGTEVEKDSLFYSRSQGGLTISGGEPLWQADFACRLLQYAQQRGFHTAVETSGCGSWERLQRIARHTDQIFYDLKGLDPEQHRRDTGVDNRLILENLERLRGAFPRTPVVVRTPVVPGKTDGEQLVAAIARRVAKLGGQTSYELLPYHGYGQNKYLQLGGGHGLSEMEPPTAKQMERLRQVAQHNSR